MEGTSSQSGWTESIASSFALCLQLSGRVMLSSAGCLSGEQWMDPLLVHSAETADSPLPSFASSPHPDRSTVREK